MLVISPHYDDAVFSLGATLAPRTDATILTAFSGMPPERLCTEYDRGCGFATSEAAMAARALEDFRACLVLDVGTAPGLGWLDGQYAQPINETAAIARLVDTFAIEAHIVGPLGILHPDHVLIGDAVLAASERLEQEHEVWLYEELPYRVRHPEFAYQRVEGLRERGWTLELLPEMPHDDGLKAAAVACYRSQLAYVNDPCLMVPERIWSATR